MTAERNNTVALTTPLVVFNYDLEQAPKGQKVQLLVDGGTATYGYITSIPAARAVGIIAFAPMPVRDREEEERRGYSQRWYGDRDMGPRPPKQNKDRQRMASALHLSQLKIEHHRAKALAFFVALEVLVYATKMLWNTYGFGWLVVAALVLDIFVLMLFVIHVLHARAWSREHKYEQQMQKSFDEES